MKRRSFIGAMATTVAATGCAALPGLLPIIGGVIETIADAVIVLDRIDNAVQLYYAANPNAKQQEAYARAMGVARNTLSVALKASQGAEHATREEVDAAFVKFREAYKDLLTVLASFGFGLALADGSSFAVPQGDMPTVEIVAPDTMVLK